MLKAGIQLLNLQLNVATTAQQVTVQDNPGPSVTADPSNNASALVIQGEDLQALSDDPEDLQTDLQALAGPSAGPEVKVRTGVRLGSGLSTPLDGTYNVAC